MEVTDPTPGQRRRKDRRRTLHALAVDLRGAIEGDDVEILFQPQFSTRDGSLIGAEALVRWRHVESGEMAGDSLFEIAEAAELAHALSALIRDKALREAANWPDSLRVSLNVTAADLLEEDFAASFEATLSSSGFPPDRLTIEITEQALVSELEASATKLTQLVERGVCIALDDFGAGFCNFRYLKMLPLHYLKLDRSMVEGIVEDRRDLEVLRGIVAMAKALDLAVLAEGVETVEQRDAITREGCYAWQGYLGGKPMAAGEFAALAKA